MERKTAAFIRAKLTMIGTIIGAGVFAVPLAMKQAGILGGSIIYWGITLVILATHLLYADLILSRKELVRKRLPGQAGIVLGKWGRRITFVTHPVQIVGACLAYLILGGEFLSVIAQSLHLTSNVLFWQIVFWAAGALAVFVGLKLVARIEAWMTWGLIALLLVSIGFFSMRADPALFFQSDWSSTSAAIGVFLFAVFGWQVIPEVIAMLDGDAAKVRLAVAGGSLGAALLIWLFGVFGFAAVGMGLASSASGITNGLPASWVWLIPAVGFLAVATSFITLMQELKAMLHLDAGWPKPIAWAVSLGAPFILLLVTSRDFLSTVSFCGAVLGTLNAIIICIVAFQSWRSLKQKPDFWHTVLPIACSIVFATVLVRRLIDSV